jgi:hypothetical protein
MRSRPARRRQVRPGAVDAVDARPLLKACGDLSLVSFSAQTSEETSACWRLRPAPTWRDEPDDESSCARLRKSRCDPQCPGPGVVLSRQTRGEQHPAGAEARRRGEGVGWQRSPARARGGSAAFTWLRETRASRARRVGIAFPKERHRGGRGSRRAKAKTMPGSAQTAPLHASHRRGGRGRSRASPRQAPGVIQRLASSSSIGV